MILFAEFYTNFITKPLLEEGVMNEVPRKLLGADSDVTRLPDKRPYGFWVDRSGNFREVAPYGHEDAAEDMIRKSSEYLTSKQIPYTFDKNPYNAMFNESWMRVVTSYSTVYYVMGDDRLKRPVPVSPTTSQMRFLNFVKDLYDLERVKPE